MSAIIQSKDRTANLNFEYYREQQRWDPEKKVSRQYRSNQWFGGGRIEQKKNTETGVQFHLSINVLRTKLLQPTMASVCGRYVE